MTKQAPVAPPATWEEFLDQVKQARDCLRLRDGEECYYRGHEQEQYELLPSLIRLKNKISSNTALRTLEYDLFFEFQARARDTYGAGLSEWDVLFLMQHHGVPTRLLDWTEIFGVALYFAVKQPIPGVNPCIWLLNPYELNVSDPDWRRSRDLFSPKYFGYDADEDYVYDFAEMLMEKDGIDWAWPISLYPSQSNSRLRAQSGSFTIHGTRHEPLDAIAPMVVDKVVLPNALIPKAREFLARAGINEYSVFPDLDGLARMMATKYGISTAGKQAHVRGGMDEVSPRQERFGHEIEVPRRKKKQRPPPPRRNQRKKR